MATFLVFAVRPGAARGLVHKVRSFDRRSRRLLDPAASAALRVPVPGRPATAGLGAARGWGHSRGSMASSLQPRGHWEVHAAGGGDAGVIILALHIHSRRQKQFFYKKKQKQFGAELADPYATPATGAVEADVDLLLR
ncbi:hypothetical protein T492DRAFT_851336 [Pavlovales sp. CCMP2436]|nr:hypothetical protein T492DRAFT_851336 [Pavlovales sp. CCMP2436]